MSYKKNIMNKISLGKNIKMTPKPKNDMNSINAKIERNHVVIRIGLTKFTITQEFDSLIINKFNSDDSKITIQPKVANEIKINKGFNMTKEVKTEAINIKVEKELKRKLDNYSREHERSVSSSIRWILQKFFEGENR